MGVVCRRQVWVESVGVASWCCCNEAYTFLHIIYPFFSCIYLVFLAASSLLFVDFVKSFSFFFVIFVLFSNI